MTHQDTDESTEYHSIVKPQFQKDPWDHDYYDFVDKVDSGLKLSGVIADRPSAANAPDEAWYEATDQNLIYRNDATNGWVVIGHGNQDNPVPEGYYQTLEATDATVDNSPTDPNDVAIKDYVDSVAQGLDWQGSVINEQNTPPNTPSNGDRYLIDDNPSGDWSANPNDITEYVNSSWEFYGPNEGWAVFLEDTDLLKVYNNTNWVEFGSAIDHGALAGLGDDDHTQYLLVDGTRVMSGNLDMGNNNINNVGTTDSNSYTLNGSNFAQGVAATGEVTLTNGEATIDTGISAVDATFTLALGVDDPGTDVDVSGRLFWDDSAGTYKIDIVEATTNVGSFTVNYDVVRVR